MYLNTIAVADNPILGKTNAAIGTAYTTAHQICKRAVLADADQQVEIAGLEAGDVLTVTCLATTVAELWGVLDA